MTRAKPKTTPIRVLSLGAGVQSSTVFLMSCRGDLPKVDHAVFADTQWEPEAVYRHLEWLEDQGKSAGIPVHRVTAGNLRKHTMEGFVRGSKNEGQRYASMPLHVLNNGTDRGMIRRQCTREYKIDPIERFVRRELLGLKKGQRAPSGSVDQWFGISADEAHRSRTSDKAWQRFVYPLLGIPDDMLPRPWTRMMCMNWLREHYPDRDIPRSACIGCPYHSDAEWRNIKQNPEEWKDAVEVDRAIRNADGIDGEVFLHRSCKPLEKVDLRSDVDKGQMVFSDFGEECSGYCGC